MKKYVHYIPGEPDAKERVWRDLKEFRFELEPGEFSLIWAAIQVRTKALTAAEKVFPDYNHPEPLNIGGVKRIVEIGSALSILTGPLLVNSPHSGRHPELIKMIQKGEKAGYTWRVREEPALQAMASIGWLCDVSKAKQPPITKATTDITYASDLLPSNTVVKDDAAPSGYNKKQITLMEDTRQEMKVVLEGLPELADQWLPIPIVIFGQKLFRTTSKIFTSLPDLEEEERNKFEELKGKATKKEPATGE